MDIVKSFTEPIGQVKGDHTFQWIVEDVFFKQYGCENYYSPEFSFAGASWRISLYIYEQDVEYQAEHYIGLFFTRTSTGQSISLNISFSSNDGKSDSIEDVRYTKHETTSPLCILDDTFIEFVFPITVNLKYLPSSEDPDGGCIIESPKSVCHKNKLLCDIKRSFCEEDCDVLLKVKGQEFRAHKFILKARSPIFADILQSVGKKQETTTVDITDCDLSSFADFLYFLYSGEVATLSKDNAYSLFVAANLYHVQDLTTICYEYIKENLSIETFCDALAVAHLKPELHYLTTRFFIKNAPKIIPTPEWQSFLPHNSDKCDLLLIKRLAADKRSSK